MYRNAEIVWASKIDGVRYEIKTGVEMEYFSIGKKLKGYAFNPIFSRVRVRPRSSFPKYYVFSKE